MKAIILAAGVGRRLSGVLNRPKSLLSFNGRSLMQRHVDNLSQLGVEEICLCLGYEQEKILGAIDCPSGLRLSHRFNPDYREGSIISLWTMRDDFLGEEDVLLMDADVLYESSILADLVNAPRSNLLLIDQNFVPGDEPVKICLKGGRIVEFRKSVDPALDYDTVGESVGFFRFSPAMGAHLLEASNRYIESGQREAPCEEAIRDVLLANPNDFDVCDIRGKKWIEIDFPEDIARAEKEILPAVDN